MQQVWAEAAIAHTQAIVSDSFYESIATNAIGGLVSGLILVGIPFLFSKRSWPRRARNEAGRPQPPRVIRVPTVVVREAKQARTTKRKDEDGALLVAMFVAVMLFIWQFQTVFWIAAGMVVGLIVMLAATLWRAVSIRAWWTRDLRIVFEVLVTATAVTVTWLSVFTQQYKGTSIPLLAAQIGELYDSQKPSTGWFSRSFMAWSSLISENVVNGTLLFPVFLTGAVALSFLMLTWSLLSLLDWHCYIGYLLGSESPWVKKRMSVYAKQGWRTIAFVALLTLLTLCFASGVLLPLFEYDLAALAT